MPRKAEVSILISDKLDSKPKKYYRRERKKFNYD